MVDIEDWLSANNESALKVALKSAERTEKQLEEHVKILTEWMTTQPHLPEKPSGNFLVNMLLMNKFSIEKCKQRIDMFYTVRTLLPEIYEKMDSRMMVQTANELYFFPLPKRTAGEDRIYIAKIVENCTENWDFDRWMGYASNILGFRMDEDILTTNIVIDDVNKIKLSELLKITPIHLKKAVMILEKVYSNRIKQWHFVNCPSYAYNLLALFKSLIKPKLASRIFIHEDCSKLGDIVPLEILPKEYGGSELSLFELNELWKKKLATNASRFDTLAKLKTYENLRPSPLVNDEIFGFHGNFRKLEMD
nr:alpha-tocopherol transfer protein-like [Leptinotarsa decemlineata]